MKDSRKIAKQFLYGFFLAFILFNFTMCPKESISPSEDKTPTGVESTELKTFNTSVESAFLSGNADDVLKITYENYAEILKTDLKANPAKIKLFGEAFKNRKLVFVNELYAEYDLTIDGKTFNVALGQSGDGKWKIIRY